MSTNLLKLQEAHRLWVALHRPNTLIKVVPDTAECLQSSRTSSAKG